MRIIGKTTDYYDYVGHAQGYDSDPHATIYNRNDCPKSVESPLPFQHLRLDALAKGVDSYKVSSIIVGEYEFVYVTPNVSYHATYNWDKLTHRAPIMVCAENRQFILDTLHVILKCRNNEITRHNNWFITRFTRDLDKAIELNGTRHTDDQHHALLRRVGVPVFEVMEGYRSHIFVSETIPKLSERGISSLLTPEQCYQAVDHALTNIIKDNPDNTPANVVPDKAKVANHGFDVKASFRHRK